MKSRASYWLLLPYLRPHWRTILQAFICTLIFTLCWPLLAWIAGLLLGYLVQGNVLELAQTAAIVAGIFLVQKLAQYGQDAWMARPPYRSPSTSATGCTPTCKPSASATLRKPQREICPIG
ncbi:hypothetical protein [Egbenema bharatensis]|uniref:hypothetical protein n=1 Tax=Egbenema bharatensis TaxID=3463334 RepID=UPI003A88FE53